MKPKSNKQDSAMDLCQTPPYAIKALQRGGNFTNFHTIAEPASGEGFLALTLEHLGYRVRASDIRTGTDFFESKIMGDAIITNPPFSEKHLWLERCCELNKPFALLYPFEAIMTGRTIEHVLYNNLQIIGILPRLNFKMPLKGWRSSAQFPTCWITRYFGIRDQLDCCHFDEEYVKNWRKALAALPPLADLKAMRKLIEELL